MKNFLLGVFAVLLGIVLGIGGLCLTGNITTETKSETQSVQTCAGSILSQPFESVTEILPIHQELNWEQSALAEFENMDPATVSNVANMLFKSYSHITIYEIVDEYKANRNIYDNIIPGAVPDTVNSEPIATNDNSANETTTDGQTPSDPDPVAEPEKNTSLDSIKLEDA